MKILIVEDEKPLCEALVQILKNNHYSVDAVYNGIDGLDYARTGIYDVIMLDIMLPGLNGLEVLRSLRNEKISSPVLLLTARSEVNDKITGLDTGADDYLTKPFVTGELLARIRALTRRQGEFSGDEFVFGNIRLSKGTHDIVSETPGAETAAQSVRLGLKEYEVFEILMKNKNQIIPKERFIEKVWGYDSDAEYNNIEVYISFLRKKLSALNSDIQIKAVRGIGYTLEKLS